MYEKSKRKRDTSTQHHLAVVISGNMVLTWLIWWCSFYLPSPPDMESLLIALVFLGLPSSLLWVFFALHHAQKHRLRWWEWILISAAIVNHYILILILLGNTGESAFQGGTLF